MAFRQALVLANCLVNVSINAALEGYNAITLSFLPSQTIERVTLGMDRLPAFRRRAISALVFEPKLFASILHVHVGAVLPAQFVATHELGLAARYCAGIAATRQKSLSWKAAAWITKVHPSFVMIDMRLLGC